MVSIAEGTTDRENTDMSTSAAMTITSSPTESAFLEPAASNALAPAVGGAVGALTVAIVVVIVVVVIALVIVRRGQKGSMKVENRKKVSVHSYTNALYDGK